MDALSLSNLQLKPAIWLSRHQNNQHRRCHVPRRAQFRSGSAPSLSSLLIRVAPLPSLSIRAKCSSDSSSSSDNLITNPSTEQASKTLNPSPNSSGPLSFLKLPLCVAVAAAALVFSRFTLRPLPALAEPPATTSTPAPTSTPTPTSTNATTVEEDEENEDDGLSEEQQQAEQEALRKQEVKLREHLSTHPDDVEAVKALLDIKMQKKNHPEIIEIASRLVELQPDEHEWRLLKGHVYCFMGEIEPAKSEFEMIIQRNPDIVEAYHGLVMAASKDIETSMESAMELEEVEKRIKGAMEVCSKEKKGDKVKEFKLLMGQIRVIEGDYEEALKVYQELEKEEPRDYRSYLCQGIVYTLMRKKDEAKKQFEKYRRFVPKEHPFGKFFEDNVMNADKVTR